MDLYDKFIELSLEGYLTLEQFLERAAAGEFGKVTSDELVDFIESMEQNTLSNIELKLEESPGLLHLREQKIVETEEKFARLKEKYRELRA